MRRTKPANFDRPTRRLTAAGRRVRGFTLIEVLATLLLMAIALPAVMEAVSTATGAADAARRRTEAGALAESKLSELVATGDWQSGSLGGDFATDPADYRSAYHWQAAVGSWDQASASGVEQLDVAVTWSARGGQDQSISLSTLVYPAAVSSTTTAGSTGTTSGTATGGGTP